MSARGPGKQDSAEVVARAQVAALGGLAYQAEWLRGPVADLCNEVHTMPLERECRRMPLDREYLRPTTSRIRDLSFLMARVAKGHREAHASDWLMTPATPSDPDAIKAVTAETVADIEAVARCQAAALDELASLAEQLRSAAADLFRVARVADLAQDDLKPISARVNDLAADLARATRGYRQVRIGDMLYPEILADLRGRRWVERPGWKLGGIVPPVPPAELGSYRGYLRAWERGLASLQLWFSAPGTLVYATAGIGRRLQSSEDVRAVTTAREEIPCSGRAGNRERKP